MAGRTKGRGGLGESLREKGRVGLQPMMDLRPARILKGKIILLTLVYKLTSDKNAENIYCKGSLDVFQVSSKKPLDILVKKIYCFEHILTTIIKEGRP